MSNPDPVPPTRQPWECPAAWLSGQPHAGERYCGRCGAAMFWRCATGHDVPLWATYCTTCGSKERTTQRGDDPNTWTRL